MSHITDVRMQVRDLESLKQAAEALGLDFKQGQKTFTWYGRYVGDSQLAPGRDPKDYGKCEHALKLKDHRAGDYEVGVVQDPDGSYALLYDSWGPGKRLEEAMGRGLSKLKQEYGAAVVARKAPRGFTVHRELLDNGTLRMRLRQR